MHTFFSIFSIVVLIANTLAGELRCLRPGALVLSMYKDSRYFPGRVETLGESIDVTFDNGKQQSYSAYGNDVIVDDVPDVSELVGGSRVLARRPNSVSFEPGFVNGTIEGFPSNDTFLVNYDSGDSIARNINEIRLATKPNNCMNEKGIYIGCFQNVLNNYLTNYYPVNPTDVATCNWACYSRGFNFAGLQNGTWCFCGNHINDTLKVDDNECNIACRDSRGDVCGGYERMTVYWTGAEPSNSSSDEQSNSLDASSTPSDEQDSRNSKVQEDTGCTDIYDSAQCNAWAEDSRCIHDPDWMIANCKRSCYACSYNHDSTTDNLLSSSQSPSSGTTDQSQSPTQNMYQSSDQSSYGQNHYQPPQDMSAQYFATESQHSTSTDMTSASYLGCFTDSPSSHDLEYLADIRPLSIRACITKCKSMRFPYAGVQSSSSCYCGLHYGKYGQVAHEDCNSPCEADPSEMCGGISKNSLYNTGFSLKRRNQMTENAFTRKTLPSPKSLRSPGTRGDVTARSLFLSSPPASSYQSSGSFYRQPSSTAYNPNTYNQATSTYYTPARPPQSAYNQATYTQTNNYPAPAPGLSNQMGNVASPSAAVSTTNQQSPDFSPRDSSSYGWRETYVKLRAQEQARSSRKHHRKYWRPRKIKNKSWKHHKLKNVGKFHTKIPSSVSRNSNKGVKYPTTHSHHTSRNNWKISREHGRVFHRPPKKVTPAHQSFVKPSLLPRKNMAKNITGMHKNFAKPGIFLRKKTSKKNSFLAFLPHEVAKDESLLENVYNMLSQMLKNLRKRRKTLKTSHSMKTLQQYLKLPGTEHRKVKTRNSPKEYADRQKSISHSTSRPKVPRKIGEGAENLKLHKPSSMPHSSLSSARPNDMRNTSKGQKQLSNQPRVESQLLFNDQPSHTKKIMHLSSEQPSHMTNNFSLSDDRAAGRPSYIYKVIVRPESASSDKVVTSSLPNNSKIGLNILNNFQNVSSFESPSLNISRIETSVYSGNSTSKSNQDHSSTFSTNDSKHVAAYILKFNQSEKHVRDERRPKSDRTPHHSRYQNHLKLNYSQNEISSNHSNVNRQGYGKHKANTGKKEMEVFNGTGKHHNASRGIFSKEHSKARNILKIDAHLAKEMKANGTQEILVEKSDEDIISTIVDLLKNEKSRRRPKWHKLKSGYITNKRPGYGNSVHVKNHMRNFGGNSTTNDSGISKKDNVTEVPEDEDDLMEDEEHYKEESD